MGGKKDKKKKKKGGAGAGLSKLMQLKRKMSNSGIDPYADKAGADL